MSNTQRDNSGSLFVNNRKQTEKSPDYSGSAVVLGRQMYISGWIKQTMNGKTFLSLAFNEPNQNQNQQRGYMQCQNPPQYAPGGFQQTGQFPSQPQQYQQPPQQQQPQTSQNGAPSSADDLPF